MSDNDSNNKDTSTSTPNTTTINISNEVLERIALLENEVKSLRKQVSRKERRRITYSASTKKIGNDICSKSTSTQATAEEDDNGEGNDLSESMNAEDVFRESTDSNDVRSGNRGGQSGSCSLDETTSEIYDEGDMKMVELDTMASDEVASMSSSKKSFRYNSFMTRRLVADDDYKALSEDTFTMMIMSRPLSKQWWYAFTIFLIQIALLTMILHDQYSYKYQTTPFDVPYKVHPVVRGGQFLAILLSLATQTDLVIAIITFIMLWRRRRTSWTSVAAVAKDSRLSIWTLRIALPLSCKFIAGVLVLVTTFVIVIQSDSMIELFKDFAAMQLISELDNMMFWLALHGYAGIALMKGAKKAQKVRIKDDVVKSYCGIPLRTMVLVVVFFSMMACWLYIVIGQVSGNFFYLKFPQCGIRKDMISTMNDGVCDGGAQNTIECNFDDGDCFSFNIAYPGCRVVETQLIGNGECDPAFNIPECGFDGGDCCPVMDSPRLGDGFCDGYVFNTEICGWDDGDCDDFNKNYPMCCGLMNYTLTELWNEFNRLPHLFALGDGICDNAPIYNRPECGFDGGDCQECYQFFEAQLKMDEFHTRHFDKFGDGICHPTSPLNIEICGYDGRDCYECMVHELGVDEELSPLGSNNVNVSKLGDGNCDGGVYISEQCYYDGGDCIDFVEMYPDCDVQDPSKIGDGYCHVEYDNDECGGDGGDCQAHRDKYGLHECEAPDIGLIGDGKCDGGDILLSEECAFEGGDCAKCGDGDKSITIGFIGDGFCDGVKYMTEACGFDGGDCNKCNGGKDLHKVADGHCDLELYHSDCYFDGGDCSGNDKTNTTNAYDDDRTDTANAYDDDKTDTTDDYDGKKGKRDSIFDGLLSEENELKKTQSKNGDGKS